MCVYVYKNRRHRGRETISRMKSRMNPRTLHTPTNNNNNNVDVACWRSHMHYAFAFVRFGAKLLFIAQQTFRKGGMIF